MDTPITASFRWSAAEMLLANRLYMRYSKQGRQLRRVILVGVILFLTLGITNLVRRESFLGMVLPFFLMAAGFLSSPLFMRRVLLKAYAQKPDRDQVVTYEISAERITTRSEVASTELLWRALTRAQRVPEGFLLYLGDRNIHWLPAHGFQDAAEVDRLAELIKAKVPQYDQVA